MNVPTDDGTDTPEGARGLVVEFDTPEVCPLVFRDDANLVLFFISWAYSIRFGGMHELAQAALHLQRRHKVDLRPLLTYADREVDDPDDQFALDHAWQNAAALAICCRATADAIDSDDATLRGLLEGYEALPARLRDLAALCDWGAERGAPVRITFSLG